MPTSSAFALPFRSGSSSTEGDSEIRQFTLLHPRRMIGDDPDLAMRSSLAGMGGRNPRSAIQGNYFRTVTTRPCRRKSRCITARQDRSYYEDTMAGVGY
jgi:hypothetical protein